MSEEFLEYINTVTSDGQSELVVDTNVVVDMRSNADLLHLGDELRESAIFSPKFPYRRKRARDATLLAHHLGRAGVLFGTHGNETVDKLTRDLAPKSDHDAYAFTTAVVLVVQPFVWKLRHGALREIDHGSIGNAADLELLRVAKSGLPLITNEGFTHNGIALRKNRGGPNLRGKCIKAGVPVYTPGEYLALKGVEPARAAKEFMVACEAGALEAICRGVMNSPNGHRAIADMLDHYRWLFLPDDEAARLAARRSKWHDAIFANR